MSELSDEFESYLRRKGGTTHEETKRALRGFAYWCAWHDIDPIYADPLDIEDFLFDAADTYAPGTVDKTYTALNGLYKWLSGVAEVREDDPMGAPHEGISRADFVNGGTRKREGGKKIHAKPEEVAAMCEHAPPPSFRNELIIRTGFQTAARASELRSMKVEQVDLEARKIRDFDRPKVDDVHTASYRPSLDTMMRIWIDQRRESYAAAADSPYLFVGNRSAQLTPDRINEIVKDAAEGAGVQEVLYVDAAGRERKKLTAHALRHGHGYHADALGVPITKIKEQMGHESIETTQQYVKPDDVSEVYDEYWG